MNNYIVKGKIYFEKNEVASCKIFIRDGNEEFAIDMANKFIDKKYKLDVMGVEICDERKNMQ